MPITPHESIAGHRFSYNRHERHCGGVVAQDLRDRPPQARLARPWPAHAVPRSSPLFPPRPRSSIGRSDRWSGALCSARRRSGGGLGGGWGLCVAAVAGCGAAGRFRQLGFGARGRAAVTPITVLALASHALGRGTVRCRAGTRRRWGGGMRGPGPSGRGWRALGCTRCLRGRGGSASTSGLRCRVSEGRSGSGCPGRRTQGRWAYACRALTM